ncbi:recombinase family protein [Kribbella italica]|uniref:DNA invertase Pin-like site-specific DNA recombinase n=1 Tax=Kribbella italica TaxID=1540520 RepID=A0A7W9J2C2_9ACTN|nr:recombinase family protein [Kribbella italica]MBB5834386.1 DNA invertase Pin-like site-specific DNA recombinase [Kribbella italica]
MIRAYTRVSTVEQADSGAGLAAQRDAITREAAYRDWGEVEWYVDGGESGKDLERPDMTRLLSEIARGDVLVTSKVDRVSRSLVDFATLMERSQREGWSIIALDLGLDLSTPQGEFVATILAGFARMERRLIGDRTRDAMAAMKANGKRFGSRSRLPVEVQERIEALHCSGRAMTAIAELLTAEQVPTSTGCATWYASTIRSVLQARANDRLAGLL